MTKELAREVSGFYLSSPCEVWWIAESVLNVSRSRADGTMSSWLLYFRNFYKFPYSFLYYLDAIMDEMRKRGRHLVQYFCQWWCAFTCIFFFVEFFLASKGSKKPIDADTHGECIKSFQNARFFVEIKQLVLADDFLFVNWRILATNSCFFPTNVWPMKLIWGVERIPTKYEFR